MRHAPRILIESDREMSQRMAAELRAQWEAAVRGGRPVIMGQGMRVRYLADEGFQAYRRSLYGEPGINWMPVLEAAFMGTLGFLVLFIAWLVMAA